ncbi:MAG TPA: hypothetical protein VEO20_11080 [Thermoplasmata archaeon]|nr:hypothetical protein [Thermoplasmata archaeon]
MSRRSILERTGFGYTNTPTGDPTDGSVSGTTVYSFSGENFGGADALLDLTFVVSLPDGVGSGSIVYGGATGPSPDSEPGLGDSCASGCTVSWVDVPVAAGDHVSRTVTIVYYVLPTARGFGRTSARRTPWTPSDGSPAHRRRSSSRCRKTDRQAQGRGGEPRPPFLFFGFVE